MGIDWDRVKQRLECPKDENANYANTQWCNRDLIPIPKDRQTYGAWSFIGYWTVSGSCVSAWTTGSTLLAFGLSPQQAIGVVIVGGVLTGLLAVACGWMGANHHIGFTVSSRSTWGMRGSYFPVLLRVFVSCMWFGFQATWGGMATRVCIGAIIPGFAHMPNYFAASSHLETKDFIGLVIWMAFFIPACLIRPEKLQKPFVICFILFAASCIGMLAWSVSQAHGAGRMFQEPATAANEGWAFTFGITAILGAWGAGTLGQSDWTRYAVTPYSPIVSQLVSSPLTIAVTACIGIIVTSAAREAMGGDIIWNPITLLASIQDHYHSSPGVRAAVFFASLGFVASQFSISVVLNSVSCGMDLSGLWPKYINIRRGSYIMAIIGIAVQPWQLMTSGTRFLEVLSGFGVFMAPATGVMLADHLIVRRMKLKLNQLYVGNSSSIYWFDHGFNWRAFAAFFVCTAPFLPGLVAIVDDHESSGWTSWIRLYNLTFLVGVAMSLSLFLGLNFLFPPQGLGEEAPFTDEEETLTGADVAEPSTPVTRGSAKFKAETTTINV
ncbi:permease for cytosine/purines, uracil, thiamine, allantoin-domain-containing protein [Stachybotrys elegans]|uniref:Permease for cytosine/purines, uracil, thiamine, allantoin-domain-containing protein n=1 Tax=Stachybotrys elegans TaxID=80388 RepID=A0A8K0WMQ3_9HYPO|nr:permease for cytosine/purines, uracil, thiamine, allantoin-domain-containing protein [Stachybotrys elegans]